ncbi:hypothetical protein WA158_008195 [Blastocystis sp. Blastoise]
MIQKTVQEDFRYLCSINGYTNKVLSILYKGIQKLEDYAKDIQFEIEDHNQIDVKVDEIVLDTMTNCCRLLRNLCANSPANQLILFEFHLDYKVLPLYSNIQLWGAGEFTWSTKYELFIQICTQMLCNAITLFEKGQQSLWTLFFPGIFLKSYKNYKHIRKILGFTSALLYNCLCDSQKKDKYIDIDSTIDQTNIIYSRVYSLSNESELLNRILSSIVTYNEEEYNLDDTYMYGSFIFQKIFQYIHMQHFFESFASSPFPVLSPSQLMILKLFHEYILDQPTYKFSLQNYLFLSSLLPQYIYSLSLPDDIYTNTSITTSTPLSKEAEQAQLTLCSEATGIIMEILANFPHSYSENILKVFYENNIHLISIAIIKIPLPLSEKTLKAAEKEGIHIPPAPEFIKTWPHGIRTSAMKLLSNLSYQNKYMQDLIRTEGCIVHILDNMKIDQDNPTLREWALFTVRNITEDNIENQQYISEIKAQRVQVQEPLQKLGVH